MNKVLKIYPKGKLFGLLGILSGGFIAAPAFADDVSTGVVTAITGAGPQVTAVIVAMAGVLVLLVAWSLIRRAMGK